MTIVASEMFPTFNTKTFPPLKEQRICALALLVAENLVQAQLSYMYFPNLSPTFPASKIIKTVQFPMPATSYLFLFQTGKSAIY